MTTIDGLRSRVKALERLYEKRSYGTLVILTDGETAISTDTGKELTDAEIERLRRRYSLIWREYPKGLIDLI